MTDSQWTAEKDARLTELWSDGLTVRRIADELRTTRNAVIGRAHRLKLPSRPSPIIGQFDQKIPSTKGRSMSGAGEVAHARRLSAQRPAPAQPQPQPQLRPSPHAARTCQWIHTSARPWLFCGAASVPGHSWCDEHYARVFRVMT